MRKNSKAKKRNRNKKMGGGSMLTPTKREQYVLGTVVKRGLSLLGANLDDAVTKVKTAEFPEGVPSKGVRRRPTDEDKAAQAVVKAENEQILSERSADMDRATDGLLTVDPTGQKPLPEPTGSIYAIMGDDALRIKGNIDQYKGAGKAAALAASFMLGKYGTEKVMSILAGDSNEAKENLDKEVKEGTKEGSDFERAFSDAFDNGDRKFLFEGKEYRVALATDDPEIELVPQKRVQKQEGGAMEMPPEMMADPMNEVPVDTYANATPEEIEAAQVPDEEMEDNYLVFILNEALVPEEQEYLMQALEGDPQLSQIFDKVVETASEFSGSGEVTGPGDGISDSIPARLSDGEFVMTQKATEQIGADNLQTMMDDAERAYDGGMMRKNRYLGGVMSSNDDEDLRLGNANSTDADIRKLMSVRANKTPSLR